MRFALAAGSHGIVAFGLAGEVLKLTSAERRALIDVIVDEVGGSVPVLIGAGAPSVRESVELARYAEAAGADCVVLPAPMSGALAESALLEYFVTIAATISVPVMIQDAPAYVGVRLGPDLVRRIGAAAGNVRLVKLEAGPVELSEWLERLGPDFSIWGGDGGLYLIDCLRAGAAGVVPGVDLVDLLVRVCEAELRGDSVVADQLFQEVLPMLVFEMQHSIDHYNACAKQVLVKRGVLSGAALRIPSAAFGEVSQRLLDRHLAELSIGAESVHAG